MVHDDGDPESPPFLAAFSADGIYQQADYDGTNGLGAWEATGPSSANLTFVQQFADDEGEFAGRTTIRAAIEVSPDGQSLAAEFTLEFGGDEEPQASTSAGRALTRPRAVV